MERIPTGSASSLLPNVSRTRSQRSQHHHQRSSSHSQTRPESPNSYHNSSKSINAETFSNPSSNSKSLFVGINLPADSPTVSHPYTDRSLVDSAISNDYDMITSRISSSAYRKRIELLYSKAEEAWGLAIADSQNSVSSQRNNSYQQGGPYSNQRAPSSAHSVVSRVSSSASWHRGRSVSGTSTASASRRTRPRNLAAQSQDIRPFDTLSAPPLSLDDILLLPGPHLHNVIALAAPWTELDSKNPSVAALSIQVLVQEAAYALYCGVSHIVLPGPKRRTNVEQYASAVSQILATASSRVQLIVNLPFAEDDYVSSRTGIHVPPADHLSIWDVWNTIRRICNYSPNLFVALQIPPKCSGLPAVVANRWYAEPVKMLTLSASIFMPNAKKYPVLPKATQNLLFRFFSKSPFIMLADVYDPLDFAGGIQSYLLYVRHLLRVRPKETLVDSYASGYADLLQLPLQPLADNLDNSTYEVFERDATKYNIYEKAIAAALLDMPKSHVHVAVAGAGRGPLVEKTLSAATAVGKTVHIYAIEKNASACIHLARRKEFEWTPEILSANSTNSISSVDIVHTDLRTWRPPTNAPRVHLIVSELLGSFGDNELSPECLDALDTPEVLDPKCGVIIPQEYAAWFTPVMSPELYKRASNFKHPNSENPGYSTLQVDAAAGFTSKSSGRPSHPLDSPSVFHTPYVVHLNAVDYVAPNQYAKAWAFKHPSPIGSCRASAETLSETVSVNGMENDGLSYHSSVSRTNSKQYPMSNGAGHRVSSGASMFRAHSINEPGVGGSPGFNSANGMPNNSSPNGTSKISSPSRAGMNGTNNNNNGSGPFSSSVALAVAEASKAAAEATAAIKTLSEAASKNLINTRKAKHTFTVPSQCVIHGIAGFFECRLYGNIGFSTRPDIAENGEDSINGNFSSNTSTNGRSTTSISYIPDSDGYSENGGGDNEASRMASNGSSIFNNGGNSSSSSAALWTQETTAFGIPHTKDMVSWFPIWFPLSDPKYVCEQSEVDVSMWRRTDGSRVWYEWTMETFLSSGRLAAQRLPADMLDELARSSMMPPPNNSNSAASNVSSMDFDVDMSEEGHMQRIKQVASKYAELQAKRRIRTGATEIHNPGGIHYSISL